MKCVYNIIIIYSHSQIYTTQSPQLCLHQTSSYTLTFTNDGWMSESRPLGTTSEMVKEEVEPEKFQLERSYTVTVTIETVLGNVNSSATFSRFFDSHKPIHINFNVLNSRHLYSFWWK